MDNQYWSWLLGAVGVVGFVLAGRRVWWSWYVNLGCQGIWFAYAFVTQQYGFIATALVYTVVFGKNAISWTKEHREKQAFQRGMNHLMNNPGSGPYKYNNVIITDVTEGTSGNEEEKARRQPGS